ncbi:HD domain-containing protein [Paenisporosarcina sp. OV554]|uniref:HD domain-containing protein n=1 Tax=Paenisporosarcina sp. OV554 TaxID=2135694 RepID=UPI000D3A1533|nr:HD domain-containing protein [Paenisporosarcina sp. OV554]PUB13979.1 uncharacterized protein C8K15_106130 [Paenisporosarcina sp. OV554]
MIQLVNLVARLGSEIVLNAIEKCERLVKDIYSQFDASHDFQHIERVRHNSLVISKEEGLVRHDIIELAVLLHDVSDVKYSGNEGKAKETAILDQLQLTPTDRQWIVDIIESVSFSGGHEKEAQTIEAKIVRDADRLDAIGAVGIARTFAFGGAKGRKLYDWSESARVNMSEQEYRTKETSSVTHFYEKLLLLKDLMMTETGKKLALQRHEFMLAFIDQLKIETSEKL